VALVVDWKKVKHFDKNENWGDVSRVDPFLIYSLDVLREMAGRPIIIHCAYKKSGHSNNSQHYHGKAADIHIKGLNVVDQYLIAEKCGMFNGIGVYPFWSSPGLHVDIRQTPARCGRNAAGVYMPLDSKFIYSAL